MPISDVGGNCPTLIITMIAAEDIREGDAVAFHKQFKVKLDGDLFGKAMTSAIPGQTLPVQVRGCIVFNRIEGTYGQKLVTKGGRPHISPSGTGLHLGGNKVLL